MKILTVGQCRKLDLASAAFDSISSFELMKRASKAFVKKLCEEKRTPALISIFCGTGNNGGDGLCIAKMLKALEWEVEVFILDLGKKSNDFQLALDEMKEELPILWLDELSIENLNLSGKIVIDALFGTGLNRKPEGALELLIHKLNQAEVEVFSVDIPSGLYADVPTQHDAIVRARQTITFHAPKLAFLLAENSKFVGALYVADIGLHEHLLDDEGNASFYTEAKDIEPFLKPRPKFAHKGSFGHALIVAGSYGKIGAAVLATKACVQSGAGLVTVRVPKCGYKILQSTVPEAMCLADEKRKSLGKDFDFQPFTAIGIGPGIGTKAKTASVLEGILKSFQGKLVLDADALNILSMNKKLLKHLPANRCILTPHQKEFERLCGPAKNDFNRIEMLQEFARLHKVVVVLKGAYSAIADEQGKLFFNPTGNPGMATGGSGDVLTGILTALLAQRMNSLEAARSGVFLHGLAGDLASEKAGIEMLSASDLVAQIRAAFEKIRQ